MKDTNNPVESEIEKAIIFARTPGKVICQVCQDGLFSPMDKLSIALYRECTMHLNDDEYKEKNLLKIIELL